MIEQIINLNRHLLMGIGILGISIIYYILLKIQRYKTSEEIHLSGWDIMRLRGKYFIIGSAVGVASSFISGLV